MKYLLYLLILLPLSLFGFELKVAVKEAKSGDYMVYAHKRSILLFRVASFDAPYLVVEEISAPLEVKDETSSWQEWLNKKAPKHSSWTITRINTQTGKIASIFSVDDRKFLLQNPAFQFLPTLFQLNLKEQDSSKRKRIGPTPLAGEMDLRPLWLPRIRFDGKEMKVAINAYQVYWPKDASELSNKPIELYLAEKEAISYLPYWIEIIGPVARLTISTLDSGQNLTSPVLLETYEQTGSVSE